MADENDIGHRIHFLRIRRNTFKSKISKFLEWLNERQISNIDRRELCKKRDKLQKLFDTFDNDQNEREEYEDVETVEAEGNSITEHYYVAVASADSILDRLEVSTDDVVLPGPSTTATNNEVYRLEPTFNGSHKEWPQFKEDFQMLLRKCSGLSGSSKLQMLRSSLSEKMKIAIESVVGNEDNFKVTWDTLLAMYDNTYEFTMYHASRLLDTPAMPDDSTESIRNLICHVEPHLRWLEIAAKSRPDIARILLLSLALIRMDPETRRRCEQTILRDQETRDINDILKYLERHIRLQAFAKSSKPSNHEKPETKPQKSTTMESSRPTYESRPTSPSMKRRCIMSENCKVCNRKSHFPYFCPHLTSLPRHARIVAIRKAKMCEICLRSIHSTNECNTQIRCRFCGGKHNTLLHEDPLGRLTDYGR